MIQNPELTARQSKINAAAKKTFTCWTDRGAMVVIGSRDEIVPGAPIRETHADAWVSALTG